MDLIINNLTSESIDIFVSCHDNMFVSCQCHMSQVGSYVYRFTDSILVVKDRNKYIDTLDFRF